ncbi:MAG: FHA domain-containing protein [[Eubacterium] rectale]|mgnify:FL=1|nr:FHA domain-containing protein [Agathobacter rectalis]
MSFTYENQGNNTYLVYKIGASDNVDTMSLGMITNNKIDGIVPTLFTQSDTDRFIKYNISAKVSAKEFLSGVVNKKRLLGVFISVLKAIKSTEEYMIDARSLLIDLEHIYVDVSKCDAMLVCLPLVRQNESVNIPMFFKQIMFSTQFDQNENCDYVAQIINYLNSTPVFSVDAFEKLLMDIDADNLNIAASKAVAGQQKPVQPQSQSQSQQPKPMQPAMNQLKNTQVQTNMPSQGKMQSQRETQSANNVVQPNQVNFAVPNMNPQNQNRINNNVQMGTNISGTYVETTSEKQMSMFGLLTHYSKENKQIYERQKAQRKAQKEAEKNGAAMPGQNVKASNASFAIPGQPPQQRPQPAQAQPQNVMPQQPQQQFVQPQRQFTQSNQPQHQFAQPQPMPQAQQKPAQQVQPQPVQNQNANTGMTGNPSVPPQILENMTKAGNFGETTVLGVGSEAGETTVLGTSQAQIIKPYLLRIKNNERIELNKPVFRIGKERSYVDYFVSDNTAVSRSHANIINKDNEFYIVDTNSTNHTYVNGSMIQSNVETKIEHGTKIRLANEDFEFFMY